MKLEIITPEGVLLNESISNLVLSTDSGEIGILCDHANLKTKLTYTPVKYTKEDGSQAFVAVLGGVLELNNNEITIITDFAEKAVDINEAEAHKAAEKAKAEIQTLNPDARKQDTSTLIAEIQLQKEMLRLRTAQLSKNLS